MALLLEARQVRKEYAGGGRAGRPTVAVDRFSLQLDDERPAFISIAGESGSGKTTVAQLLLGFTRPTAGRVLYRGAALEALERPQERAFRQEVQAIFQDPFAVYNPFYKIDHLLTTPVRAFGLSRSAAHTRQLLEEALETVGLRPGETLGRYPHQLSGGQRQRITIARALLLRPRLIIADEPVSMVDASLRAIILETLQRLHQEFRISFLYITHDLATAYQVSAVIVVLYRGCMVECGGIEPVIREPLHPYTRALVASIPPPVPGREWIEAPLPVADETGSPDGAASGCPYTGLCPRVMARCHQAQPPLYRTGTGRAVACYLYDDGPVVTDDAVAPLLGIADAALDG